MKLNKLKFRTRRYNNVWLLLDLMISVVNVDNLYFLHNLVSFEGRYMIIFVVIAQFV